MGIGILGILVLVIILLAFFGVFGKFPDSWAWVGIVLAGVGIIMSVPTIFQMFLGRAKVNTEFEVYCEGLSRELLIFLKNPPITNWIINKILRVKREPAQSLAIEYRITECGTQRIVVPIRHARIYPYCDSTEIGNNMINLPPTFSVGAAVTIVYWDSKSKNVKVMPDRLRQQTVLLPGIYIATIILQVDGLPQTICRQFVVGDKSDDLIWLKDVQKKNN